MSSMNLSSSEGSLNSSMKFGVLNPPKSPRYTRKKRLNSQKRSNAVKDKLSLKQGCASDGNNDDFLKSSSHEQIFGDFLPPITVEKFGQSSGLVHNSLDCRNFRRSFSFPMVYSKSPDKHIFSKSFSLLDSNAESAALLSNAHDQQKSCDNSVDISIVETDNAPTNLLRNNSTSGCSVSQRSSTSTICERHDSVGSEFSQISIIDMKEIESLEVNHGRLNSSCRRKVHHSRSKSDVSITSVYTEDGAHSDVFSLPNSFSELTVPQKKSIFEGKQMVVPTECFFPRPRQGQSLTNFLSSNDFNISAELDRENAHFCISEALIAAFEHMKFSRMLKIADDENDSDEEIRKLKQRIRIRKRERQREKASKTCFWESFIGSDGRTDTTTSASDPASSHSSDFEVESFGSEDEVEDLELSANTDSNLSSMKGNGLSLSMASLYSDADLARGPLSFEDSEKKFQESDSNNLSAESVALSLLRKFSEKHLPKASELKWLVSEQEAPQRLLPLPNSWPISPDAIEEEYKMRLRGNFEWAPPRPQIIFSILPNLKKKEILERQKYKCAGCGMKIEKNYVNRFRYCNYFGKYFCQCCHSNETAYIPGRILWKWDFTKQYVSKFAWGLLDQMYSDPLFNVEDINSNLYQRVKQLDNCRVLRTQLYYLRNFMNTCRKAENIRDFLNKENQHLSQDPHMYSLSDFVQVKKGELVKLLRHLVNPAIEHVKQCVLCQAKGFICEICNKDKDIIFPFQLDKVVLCQVCGSCFHKRCFKNVKCPRCERIAKRKNLLNQQKEEEKF